MRWCQGFSEPELAAPTWPRLKTTAVLDGDEWVINGQKVWTTQAPVRRLLLPARPHRSGRRRSTRASRTCSCRCSQPGIEVRGITQPDGTAEFNEVFFDDARCPKDNVVGGVNNGWEVANTTLAFERGMSATTGYRRFEEELEPMVAAAQANGRDRRPADPPAAGRATTRRSRSCASTACASLSRHAARAQGPGRRRARRHQQDVLVRDAPARRWSWPSTSSAPTAMLVDAGPAAGSWPGTARDQRPRAATRSAR